MRISDWSSDVCSSDLIARPVRRASARHPAMIADGADRPARRLLSPCERLTTTDPAMPKITPGTILKLLILSFFVGWGLSLLDLTPLELMRGVFDRFGDLDRKSTRLNSSH